MLARVSHSAAAVKNNVTRLLGVAFHCKFPIGLRCYALEKNAETLHSLLKLVCGAKQTMFLECWNLFDNGGTNLQARIKLARKANQSCVCGTALGARL